jgi:hypothetical protein
MRRPERRRGDDRKAIGQCEQVFVACDQVVGPSRSLSAQQGCQDGLIIGVLQVLFRAGLGLRFDDFNLEA